MTNLETQTVKRKKWSFDEKMKLVNESFESGRKVSEISKEYGINTSQLFKWRREFGNGSSSPEVRQETADIKTEEISKLLSSHALLQKNFENLLAENRLLLSEFKKEIQTKTLDPIRILNEDLRKTQRELYDLLEKSHYLRSSVSDAPFWIPWLISFFVCFLISSVTLWIFLQNFY
jgi:transposase